ncbi:hypothetical protein K439DRAFT_1357698 [Ramaria rubella]|nr:hypothetical protein K439DRAFT_1357698 [Ramaria rubella]
MILTSRKQAKDWWKCPKWTHGFLWSENATHRSPSAMHTETEIPLPFVPETELNNFAAQHTITENPDLFKIVSPINIQRFEELLLIDRSSILSVAVLGKVFGCHPDAPETLDCLDQQLIEKGIAFARAQHDAEITEDHFSHAFGPDLLPGMYSTPIGVVPKLNTC